MKDFGVHQEIAAELGRAHDIVREAIAGLSEEQAAKPGPHGWSIKDHLVHLTLWHEMRFFEIRRIARGGSAAYPSVSEEEVTPLNESVVRYRRPLTLAQVVSDLEFAWEMIDQAVAASPEDRLDQRLYKEIGIEGGAAHDRSHVDAIKKLRI